MKFPTVVIDLKEGHCVAVALECVIDAIIFNSALTGVLIVVCVASGPEIPFNSIPIIPPGLGFPIEFKRGVKTVVLNEFINQSVNRCISKLLNDDDIKLN